MSFEAVADGVLVRTSRRESTTTTLVLGAALPGGRRAGLLVDPAWDTDELEAIADELDEHRVAVVAGLATHAHHDHLLWHPRLGGAPRWASPTVVRVVGEHRGALLSELRADATYPTSVLGLFADVRPLPAGATGVPDPDGVLPATVLVVHDAHAPGHTALWLPGTRVLVAGDMLSDVEPPLPWDEITEATDMTSYRAGLDALAPLVAQARVLVPGHGTPSDRPLERLDADRRRLEELAGDR
jgi:glyoxylase-like metal-dependent hydrolase (beta-lactamase superfamily II)